MPMSLRLIEQAIRRNVWATTPGQTVAVLYLGELSAQPAMQAVKKELGKEQIDV
jgi:hypothetical protein